MSEKPPVNKKAAELYPRAFDAEDEVARLQDELERWKEAHRVAVRAYEDMKAKRGKASSENFRQGEEIKGLSAKLPEASLAAYPELKG